MAAAAEAAQTRVPRRRASAVPRRGEKHRPEASRAAAAHEAVARLLHERPQASAKNAVRRGGVYALAGAAVLLVGAVLAREALTTGLVTATWAGFAALIVFRAAATLTPAHERPRPGPSRREPPVYTVLVPLHREADVIAELAASLMALDYPRERLDIKIILEADDYATIAAAEALALPACFEILRVPSGAPRTKPRALNFALAFARGDFVVIFDAEDRPAPSQLYAALDAFDAGDERLACVQAPLAWYNARETWLTRQFALEYAALFHVVLPALARWGWPFPLGGTSNHFRRAALERAGAWDPFNVTEDADLGFRLAELGYASTVIAPGTREEAVTTLRPWTRQRARWIKGFLQTLLVRLANLSALAGRAGPQGIASLIFTIALPLASSFLHGPIALCAAAALMLGALPPLAAAFLVASYAVAAASVYMGLVRSGQRALAPAIVLMPLYWPLHSYAAVRALADLVRRPFHWEKTRHGVTRVASTSGGVLRRTARRAADVAGAVDGPAPATREHRTKRPSRSARRLP